MCIKILWVLMLRINEHYSMKKHTSYKIVTIHWLIGLLVILSASTSISASPIVQKLSSPFYFEQNINGYSSGTIDIPPARLGTDLEIKSVLVEVNADRSFRGNWSNDRDPASVGTVLASVNGGIEFNFSSVGGGIQRVDTSFPFICVTSGGCFPFSLKNAGFDQGSFEASFGSDGSISNGGAVDISSKSSVVPGAGTASGKSIYSGTSTVSYTLGLTQAFKEKYEKYANYFSNISNSLGEASLMAGLIAEGRLAVGIGVFITFSAILLGVALIPATVVPATLATLIGAGSSGLASLATVVTVSKIAASAGLALAAASFLSSVISTSFIIKANDPPDLNYGVLPVAQYEPLDRIDGIDDPELHDKTLKIFNLQSELIDTIGLSTSAFEKYQGALIDEFNGVDTTLQQIALLGVKELYESRIEDLLLQLSELTDGLLDYIVELGISDIPSEPLAIENLIAAIKEEGLSDEQREIYISVGVSEADLALGYDRAIDLLGSHPAGTIRGAIGEAKDTLRNFNSATVPEPTSILLMVLGFLIMFQFRLAPSKSS